MCYKQVFAGSYLQSCHLELLLLGNATADDAISLAHQLRNTLTAAATQVASSAPAGTPAPAQLAADQRPRERCVALPCGMLFRHRSPARNPDEANCCVEMYWQVCGLHPLLGCTCCSCLLLLLLLLHSFNSSRTRAGFELQ